MGLRLIGVLVILVLLLSSYAHAEDYLRADEPVTASAHKQPNPLERGFRERIDDIQRPSLFEGELEELPKFIRDTKVQVNLRNYYFTRNLLDNQKQDAWALGGSLSYESGKLQDVLSIGSSVYTSQKLYGPESRDGTGLLQPGQEGYTAFGSAYVKLEYENQQLSLFRQEYDLPFINRRDFRMVPNTFQGYTFGAQSELNPHVQYIVGYIDRIRERTSTSFRYMSEQAGADGAKGVTIVTGGRYEPNEDFAFGALNLFTDDIYNIFYSQTDYKFVAGSEVEFTGSLQLIDQTTVGRELASDNSYGTQAYGGRLHAGYKDVLFTVAYTANSKSNSIVSPWGGYPGFNSLTVNDFNRAGENAVRFGITYDFQALVPGLSAFGSYTSGNAAVDDLTGENLADQQSIDLTIDYRVPDGFLEDLWIRLRGTFVNEDGGRDLHDYRIIVNQPFDLL